MRDCEKSWMVLGLRNQVEQHQTGNNASEDAETGQLKS